ncbi:MAG: GNAT family N-acetyltransferase, partial [bacterium]
HGASAMSPTFAQPTIETERLVLRPYTRADGPEVFRLAGSRAIADTTLSIPHPYPKGGAEMWIDTHPAAWEAGAGATFAVVERESGRLIGTVGIVIAPEHSRGEIGYWIDADRWNRGYCTEAASAVVTFAFDGLQLHRVEARHLTRNAASGRVMQKLGMRLEGVHRQALKKWDQFEDVAVYGLLAPDRSSASRS